MKPSLSQSPLRAEAHQCEAFVILNSLELPRNHALIAIAQEVAELLKQAYPVQADELDRMGLIDGNSSAE